MLVAALHVAQASLPAYCHKHSPKKFTQHQPFACLVLKNFLKTDYRGVVNHLKDCPALAESIDLKKILITPRCRKRPNDYWFHGWRNDCWAKPSTGTFGTPHGGPDSAVDSTGLGATCASAYFVKRRSRRENPLKTVVYHRYPKFGVVSDVTSHFILAFQSGRGPCPDVGEFKGRITQASRRVRMKCIIADAGYDSESNHVFAGKRCR